MYTYKIGISAEEHDTFVKASNQANLLQSSNWAKIKDNWGNERIGFYKNGQLVASASILIKPLPLGFTMLYIPRGPVMDYGDQDLVSFVIKSLKAYGKTKRTLFIKFDPALLLRQYALSDAESAPENEHVLSYVKNLEKAGANWAGRTSDIAETIQPRFQANVYTAPNLAETFPKHTKRLMKDAINRGVITTRGDLTDVTEFAKVVELTEGRKGVALRNEDYFRKMMTIYGDDAYLHLAKVNLPKRLAEYQEQLAQIEKDLLETADHQKKRLTKLNQQKASVEKYISEFSDFVQKYDEELVIAGILSVRFGNVMEMLYAGMNDDFKKFYPQYSLYPQVFDDAYQDSIIWANMGGVEGSLDDGLTKFKANFAPTFEEYIGEFDIPVNRLLYKLSQFAFETRKRLRNKH
ncbi:aminoacyltransferase [Streptococcus merionis]|uniref:Peptidoglycan branched peptide synthesis protein, serine/alanine adding enzyme n=1 Tax=Streptococcus merionis TaxID=400065 RepID=A0A239SRV1_9STRE|nr:aminoacyltransferase [Streptococcus merionis]SNU88215.1 peptidoglycan branched peptide synthesis protein, serine/alanine adding enzyme [Streptococcus merionis]